MKLKLLSFFRKFYQYFQRDDGWITLAYTAISKATYESYIALLQGEFTELQEFHDDSLQIDGWYKGDYPNGIMGFQSRRTGLYYKKGGGDHR